MFGKNPDIEWKTAEPKLAADRRAAILQHNIVLRIRNVMHERHIAKDADLAEPSGMSVSQIGRVLRGESAMTLTTVAALELALQRDLLTRARDEPDVPGQ